MHFLRIFFTGLVMFSPNPEDNQQVCALLVDARSPLTLNYCNDGEPCRESQKIRFRAHQPLLKVPAATIVASRSNYSGCKTSVNQATCTDLKLEDGRAQFLLDRVEFTIELEREEPEEAPIEQPVTPSTEPPPVASEKPMRGLRIFGQGSSDDGPFAAAAASSAGSVQTRPCCTKADEGICFVIPDSPGFLCEEGETRSFFQQRRDFHWVTSLAELGIPDTRLQDDCFSSSHEYRGAAVARMRLPSEGWLSSYLLYNEASPAADTTKIGIAGFPHVDSPREVTRKATTKIVLHEIAAGESPVRVRIHFHDLLTDVSLGFLQLDTSETGLRDLEITIANEPLLMHGPGPHEEKHEFGVDFLQFFRLLEEPPPVRKWINLVPTNIDGVGNSLCPPAKGG